MKKKKNIYRHKLQPGISFIYCQKVYSKLKKTQKSIKTKDNLKMSNKPYIYSHLVIEVVNLLKENLANNFLTSMIDK